MGCFHSRLPEQHHPCILVGSVIYGKPVADFNRRLIAFRIDTRAVEDGSVPEVEAGKGEIKGVEKLGRVTVLLEEQLCIIQEWLKVVMKEAGQNISEDTVYKGIQAFIRENQKPRNGVKTVELEIFKGYVVNRLRNRPFAYRKPSSFP